MVKPSFAVIPITSIVIEERFRKELGNMLDLITSIKDKGLIQPISVKKIEEGQYRLLAGERRTVACKQLSFTEIPAMIYDESITDLDMLEVELHENMHRLQMEWHEQNALIARIDSFYRTKEGSALPGQGSTGHTLKKTAEIAGVSTGKASQAIKMDQLIKQFPEFKAFKSEAEVKKFLEGVEKKVVQTEKAKRYQSVNLPERQKKLIDSYVVGDFFEGIKTVPDKYACLVEIDPPYGIELDKNRKGNSGDTIRDLTMSEYHEVADEDYSEFLPAVLKAVYPKMMDDSWLILWYDMKRTETIIGWLRDAGFNCRGIPGIWEKNRGQTQQPKLYLANYFETFLYAWKGRPFINAQGRGNIFTAGVPDGEKRVHPTERPINLIQEVITTFVAPTVEGKILVPFAGSGNTILASANISRDSIGFDLSEEYKAGFINRVAEGQPPFYGTKTLSSM